MTPTDGARSDRLARQRRLLRAGVALYLVSVVATLVQLRSFEIATLTANGAFVLVGSLIVVRRNNHFGLMLVAYGAIWAMATAMTVTGEALEEAGRIDAASWTTLIGMIAGGAMVWLIAAIWLVFPDGRPRTETDRRLLLGSGALAAIAAVAGIFAKPQALPETKAFPHPFIDDEVARVLYDILQIPIGLFFLLGYVVAARLVFRMRRGDPIERRQVGWIAASVIANLTILIGNVAIAPLGTENRAFLLIDAVAMVLIPLGIGIAIFRYRLYDIDVIVSKTVTYLGLAASITLLYAAVVVGPLLIIGRSDEGGPGLVLPIVATALVAVVFEPIRTRLQRWANRLVYGDRATPHEVLSQVTSRLAEVSVGDGTDDLARLLAEGTGADQAVVWLKSDGSLRPEGIHPLDSEHTIEPIPADGLADGEFTESRPVLHQGVLFGALSITKARNDPITPNDRELLSDVAAGAGLLLRNISLNRELEERAVEVRASRRRLIAAQDAERHRLERDLHDGAQQQVVALKVKLGIARTIAEREGAEEIAARVSALAEETQQAVDALRAVAHGIYPPLLESEGLESTLRALARTSSIPLVLDISGLTRYDRQIEETVYFSVLDTVERARMSGAREVEARLAAVDGELLIEVGLDGVTEIDLTAVSDRIDASGGMFRIDQTDGGTALTARFPVLDSTVLASSASTLISELS